MEAKLDFEVTSWVSIKLEDDSYELEGYFHVVGLDDETKEVLKLIVLDSLELTEKESNEEFTNDEDHVIADWEDKLNEVLEETEDVEALEKTELSQFEDCVRVIELAGSVLISDKSETFAIELGEMNVKLSDECEDLEFESIFGTDELVW